MREDRSLLELIDADYTFLNEELAKYYGIPGVKGDEMRRVELPADSPRGGVLTQGTMLVVTSNPDAHFAGEARPVHARQHPRHARPAAAQGRAAAGSRRRRGHRPSGVAPRSARHPSQGSALCRLPRPLRSARPGAGKL